MGRKDDIFHFQQLRRGIIAELEYIQTGAMNRPVFQCLHQSLFIDQRTAAGVDQDGRRFHLFQFGFTDDMVGFRCIRGIQRDKIGLGEELLLGNVCHVQLCLFFDIQLPTVMIEDFHSTGIRTFGKGLSDTSHTDNPQCLPSHVDT